MKKKNRFHLSLGADSNECFLVSFSGSHHNQPYENQIKTNIHNQQNAIWCVTMGTKNDTSVSNPKSEVFEAIRYAAVGSDEDISYVKDQEVK